MKRIGILTIITLLFSFFCSDSGLYGQEDRGATDFVFGNNDLTDNIVQQRIQALSGIVHNHRIDPLDPKIGDEVTIKVSVGDRVDATGAWCYYTTDGSDPKGANGIAENGMVVPLKQTGILWENLIWGYITEFEGKIPALPKEGLVRYVIEVGGQYANGKEGSEGSKEKHPYYSYAVDNWKLPDWINDAVMYYVLPDRFNPGKGKDWVQTTNLEKHMGGTLKGIQEKLDHIESIGVNVLWLMPFMYGPEYHKYGATDFYKVDPRFGTEEDLKNLIDDAHARDMKVIVDFVANHCSNQNPIFQDALANPDSKYRDWFEIEEDGSYTGFFGTKDLPHLVNETPEVRAYILQLAKHWIVNLGLDGFDLDYAIGPSHEFWATFGFQMRKLGKEVVIFTEGVTTPESLLTYAGKIDGCQDFAFCQASRKTFAYDKMSLEEFERYLSGSEKFFPDNFTAPVMIDNHNMDRFLFVSNDEVNRLKLASSILYSMSRPISIWAGTELGMSQEASSAKSTLSAGRPATTWENINEDVLNYFKKLGEIRSEHLSMARGIRTPLIANSERGILAYEKTYREDRMVVIINKSNTAQKVEMENISGLIDLLNGIPVRNDNGVGMISIPAQTAVYLGEK